MAPCAPSLARRAGWLTREGRCKANSALRCLVGVLEVEVVEVGDRAVLADVDGALVARIADERVAVERDEHRPQEFPHSGAQWVLAAR
jgi:hypothetical protein